MRYFNIRLIAAIIISLIFVPIQSKADVITDKDTVTGTVIGVDKEPVPGAKVEIIGQPYSAFTDLDGRFNIKCDPGAKKVLVSYPKTRDVKKKISPNMTVRIGSNWRVEPEDYQWFVGASVGVGITQTNFYNKPFDFSSWDGLYYPEFDTHKKRFVAPAVSVMAGRVKTVGWYVKGFVNLPSKERDSGIEKAVSGGATVGLMIRLRCPLYLYYGLGGGYTDLSKTSRTYYYEWSFQADIGLLFRFKENYGINLGMNIGRSKNTEIITGSFINLGCSYFFNQ